MSEIGSAAIDVEVNFLGAIFCCHIPNYQIGFCRSDREHTVAATRRKATEVEPRGIHLQLTKIVDNDIVEVCHIKDARICIIDGNIHFFAGLSNAGINILDVTNSIVVARHLFDGHGIRLTLVVEDRHRAVSADNFSGEVDAHTPLSAFDTSGEVERKGLTRIILKIFAKQRTAGISRRHKFLLVIGIVDERGNQRRIIRSGGIGCCFHFVGVNIFVRHKIIACRAVWVDGSQHSQTGRARIAPRHRSLCVENNLFGIAIDRQFWQVVDIAFAHTLRNHRTTVAVYVNLRNISKAPTF